MSAKKTTKKTAGVTVVGSTFTEEKAVDTSTSEMISIAVSLPYDLRFDDIPQDGGGTKSITLPSINSNLRGSRTPILALAGNALCVNMPKKDWEALLAIHGREPVFTGVNGRMPCVYPVGDKAGFLSAESEIKSMRSGLEPIEPKDVDVVERKQRGRD